MPASCCRARSPRDGVGGAAGKRYKLPPDSVRARRATRILSDQWCSLASGRPQCGAAGARADSGSGSCRQGRTRTSPEQLDLTPSPRLLEILGEIPYQPWQCVAELIDNAFDDFMAETNRDPSDTPIVRVTLPKQNTADGDEIVCVADNGRGMGKEALERSLQAGYSSNARYGSLGLFGMGFNIATARLGTVTEVKTTREGDPDWLVRGDRLPADAAGAELRRPAPPGTEGGPVVARHRGNRQASQAGDPRPAAAIGDCQPDP